MVHYLLYTVLLSVLTVLIVVLLDLHNNALTVLPDPLR